MKSAASFLLIAFALTCLFSCSKHCEGNMPVHIDLQETFEQTPVRIYLDDIELYNATVTTNHALGLASSVSTTTSTGVHSLRIVTYDTYTATTSFRLDAELYIGVMRSPYSNMLSFQLQGTPFIYE
jgi:hypothetical protein